MNEGAAHELQSDAARAWLRRGGLRGHELLEWIARVAPAERERAVERLLGVHEYPLEPAALGPDLIGYVPSGVASIVRAVFEVPITPEDIFIDLGAGLGKAVAIAHLLSGARARGIELQPALVAEANASADRLRLADVSFIAGDAREAEIDDGDVFFLYLPFTGRVLESVARRLDAIAARRDVVVCTLGFDLPRTRWLRPRECDAFWLSIYESSCPDRTRRPRPMPLPFSPSTEAVVFERDRAQAPRTDGLGLGSTRPPRPC